MSSSTLAKRVRGSAAKLRNRWMLALLALALLLPAAAPAEPLAARESVCQTIADTAAVSGVPAGFLARLLWTESGFRSAATSPAGAEGVAQFMPGTAAARGLADPRDPLAAIPEAARLLVELDRRFGNLGLAAAAYNAGTARVVSWLHGRAGLPAETRLYVLAITGRPIEEWGAIGAGFARRADRYAFPGLDCLTIGMRQASRAGTSLWRARSGTRLVSAIDLSGMSGRNPASLFRLAPERAPMRPGMLDGAVSLCAAIRARGATCEVFGR